MVESEKRASRRAQHIFQIPQLAEILGRTDFNKAQAKAIGIIKGLELTSDEQSLFFLYHLWHESGTIVAIKKLTGLKSNSDAFALIGPVMESEELIEKYDSFYSQYRSKDKSED